MPDVMPRPCAQRHGLLHDEGGCCQARTHVPSMVPHQHHLCEALGAWRHCRAGRAAPHPISLAGGRAGAPAGKARGGGGTSSSAGGGFALGTNRFTAKTFVLGVVVAGRLWKRVVAENSNPMFRCVAAAKMKVVSPLVTCGERAPQQRRAGAACAPRMYISSALLLAAPTRRGPPQAWRQVRQP